MQFQTIKLGVFIAQLFFTSSVAIATISKENSKNLIKDYDALVDIHQAPETIKSLGKAVFRLGNGTGSFVKYGKSIYVMTNNHVLGYKHCARKGCFVKAVFDYQIQKKSVHKNLFLTPVAASDDVDVSFFDFKEVAANGDFVEISVKSYLEFSSESRVSIGSSVYAVGHPRTGLKKFSRGSIVKFENGYLYVDALTLPGNSGSPILESEGKVVGIHHSSAKRNDGFTRSGLLYVGRASAHDALLKILKRGLRSPKEELKKFLDVDKASTFSAAKKFTNIYMNSKMVPYLDNKKDFFHSLFENCRDNLDFSTSHAGKFVKSHDSCSIAKKWIRCQPTPNDVAVKFIMASTLTDSHPDFKTYGSYCPRGSIRKKWAALFIDIGNKYRDFHGKDPLIWKVDALSQLVSKDKLSKQMSLKNLKSELKRSDYDNPFESLVRQAKNSEKIDSEVKNIVLNYSKYTHYQFELSKIAKAAQYLYENKIITKEQFETLISSVLNEDFLTLNAKLAVEKIAYENNLI